MHVFEHLPISTLKKIIREYNLHVKISGYSKMTQSELVEVLKKHLVISDDGVIKIKEIKNVGKVSDFEKKPREKKEKVKKVVPKPVKEEPIKKAPYYFYDDLDKTIRKYISLINSLDDEHFKNQIKDYENELKYLENRKLKSAKSIEENNNKISHAKIYLNSYKKKLNDVPQNKINMNHLLNLFEQKYKINFKDFINKLDENINNISNKPYWSLYNSDKYQKIINKIYSNLNSDDLHFITINEIDKKKNKK
jgi:transcription-repair coupling factor (superfamily II helicase)